MILATHALVNCFCVDLFCPPSLVTLLAYLTLLAYQFILSSVQPNVKSFGSLRFSYFILLPCHLFLYLSNLLSFASFFIFLPCYLSLPSLLLFFSLSYLPTLLSPFFFLSYLPSLLSLSFLPIFLPYHLSLSFLSLYLTIFLFIFLSWYLALPTFLTNLISFPFYSQLCYSPPYLYTQHFPLFFPPLPFSSSTPISSRSTLSLP